MERLKDLRLRKKLDDLLRADRLRFIAYCLLTGSLSRPKYFDAVRSTGHLLPEAWFVSFGRRRCIE
jgi:hypothetical protein